MVETAEKAYQVCLEDVEEFTQTIANDTLDIVDQVKDILKGDDLDELIEVPEVDQMEKEMEKYDLQQLGKDPAYVDWAKEFTLSSFEPDIEAILGNDSLMRKLQLKLVPDAMSYKEFWCIYFYHQHQVESKKEKRQQLLSKVNDQKQENVQWDSDHSPTEEAAPFPIIEEYNGNPQGWDEWN